MKIHIQVAKNPQDLTPKIFLNTAFASANSLNDEWQSLTQSHQIFCCLTCTKGISSTACFTKYTTNGFSYEEQKRLLKYTDNYMKRNVRLC